MTCITVFRSLASMTALAVVAMPVAAATLPAPSAERAPLDLAPSVLRDAAAEARGVAPAAVDVRVDRPLPGANAHGEAAFDALRPACRDGIATAVAVAAVAACMKTGCGTSPEHLPRDVVPTYGDAAVSRPVRPLSSCPPKTFRLW